MENQVAPRLFAAGGLQKMGYEFQPCQHGDVQPPTVLGFARQVRDYIFELLWASRFRFHQRLFYNDQCAFYELFNHSDVYVLITVAIYFNRPVLLPVVAPKFDIDFLHTTSWPENVFEALCGFLLSLVVRFLKRLELNCHRRGTAPVQSSANSGYERTTAAGRSLLLKCRGSPLTPFLWVGGQTNEWR